MEVICESAHEYKIIECMLNQVLPNGTVSIVRPQTARHQGFNDGTTQGAGLRVKYTKRAPENVTKVLTFQTPTQREDGSTLLFSEISHYILEYNDRSIIIPKDQTSYTINGLSSEPITFTMRTVDTDGLKSEPITTEG